VTSIDTKELLDIAVDAAGRAGEMLLERRPAAGPEVVDTKSSPTDVVTAMDTAAERLIVNAVRSARPGDGILAEEGSDESSSTGVQWIIDPLDGTVNYLYGIPEWGVSVAAELDGELAVGVVDIAPRSEVFTAVRGEGARRDGVAVRCNTDVPLDRALVATGFGYTSRRRAYQAAVLQEMLPAVRDIRRGGSCSVDLCSVACGRVDAFYEQGTKRWDTAAGTLISREAGAQVGGFGGAEPGEDLTLAAAPPLFAALHEALTAATRSV
jgi:myo-inositol-1(or 4)-monophosphatase